jgi:uncharacterized RDD family membrane protein YckC
MTVYAEPGRDLDLQGHYAGAVTRLAAYLIDVSAVGALFATGANVIEYLVDDVFGVDYEVADSPVVASVAFTVWAFCYFVVPLAASGRTLGSAILGLRVVRADGQELDLRHAVVRVFALGLTVALFGIGFLLILVQRERRGLQDLLAGTAVVYAWDARAARLRFLARSPHAPATVGLVPQHGQAGGEGSVRGRR